MRGHDLRYDCLQEDTRMAKVKVNGIELEYECFGQDTCPAIVLIAGSG